METKEETVARRPKANQGFLVEMFDGFQERGQCDRCGAKNWRYFGGHMQDGRIMVRHCV